MTTTNVKVSIRCLPHFEGLALPAYETLLSAGMDLRCAIEADAVLAPGERQAIPTGLCIALPVGYEAQVRPRSGLALRKGISLINAPGTIDADYRGEILMPLINHSNEPVTLTRGMRVAQLIVAPVSRVTWQQVDTLPDTSRGDGGFGHTGVN